MIDSLTSKKYKTIKHIILCWGDRELLRYPYPIILSPPLKGFWPEGYVSEITHSYRGTLFSIYFTADERYPMHLKTKFSQIQPIITSEEEEEEEEGLDYDDRFLPKPVAQYYMYFFSLVFALGISSESTLVYRIYCGMLDQSQLIVKNMDLDRENLFDGIEDIKIDVSESPYKEELLVGQNRELFLARQGLLSQDRLYAVEKYFQEQSYRYGLEESKNLLLSHLGEQNPEGYSGVNENFFKPYKLRIQLVSLFELHYNYVRDFISFNLTREIAKRINLWKEPIFEGDLNRDCKFFDNLRNAERFYLRRFYRKFRLFTK